LRFRVHDAFEDTEQVEGAAREAINARTITTVYSKGGDGTFIKYTKYTVSDIMNTSICSTMLAK
jgi:hypothetical protein